VEVLIPDFQGAEAALETVLRARPDVLNHNIETVPRLYGPVRPGSRYARSLELFRRASAHVTEPVTKSGMMLGLGYTIGAISPFVLGAARDATGSFTASLWLLVAFSGLLLCAVILLPKRASLRGHRA